MQSRVLVVEDDAAVRDVLEHALSREGMETRALADGEKVLEHLLCADPYDLIILDLMLPGMDGIELCRQLRAREGPHSGVPIIMLTARDDETSVVVGLEVGADDYVTKPFSPRQLTSRVRAQLRRDRLSSRTGPDDAGGEEQRLSVAGIEIDLLRRRVFCDGVSVELTSKEFEVLALLASHPGQVYSRRQIMYHLWNEEFFGEERAADVHIRNLRKKIEPDPGNPRYVLTLRGAGYRFSDA